MLHSPVDSLLRESAKWITGGLTEKYTQVIEIRGLLSAPLTPWQEMRGVHITVRAEESSVAITSLPLYFMLFLYSFLTSTPHPFTFMFSPAVLFSWHSSYILLCMHFSFASSSSLTWFISLPLPSIRGSGINKCLLKGYHWSEKTDVTFPLLSTPALLGLQRHNAVLVSVFSHQGKIELILIIGRWWSSSSIQCVRFITVHMVFGSSQ